LAANSYGSSQATPAFSLTSRAKPLPFSAETLLQVKILLLHPGGTPTPPEDESFLTISPILLVPDIQGYLNSSLQPHFHSDVTPCMDGVCRKS
jgi:hypothetical protein